MRTQFITDTNGKKISAIVPIKEYQKMLDRLDELACIEAYDKAKAKKNKQFIPLHKALQHVEKKRKR